MLISKEVEVKLSGANINYYENLGYEIPRYFNKKENKYAVKRGTNIIVKIKDLPLQSHSEVIVSCDYCKKEFTIRYDAFINQRKGEIKSDCCWDCRGIKNEELNLHRYGVKNQFQRDKIKKKSKETILKKYGVEHPMKSAEIKQKAINTMYNNGNVQTSRQQLYIYNILGGVLNYNDNTTGFYSLDIAFPKEKIFIEYDGSGHDLQVKFGNKSKDEFIQGEIVRSCFLRRNEWRELTIVSKQDDIPSDLCLQNILSDGMKYLDSGHSWITYDIDNNKVICSEYETNYDYGRLRKITENDLEVNIN